MKADKKYLTNQIELILGEDVSLGNEIDITADKIIKMIWPFFQYHKSLNKELIEAYDEYIEFLGKELSRHEAFTVVRPYMAASGKVVTKGVELRAKIENLKTPKK